ncbi:solute carrier family 22 member 18 isoform X1 [Manis javanica]|uniref:solute carrier family 22 member 18 isoform X1 n=2 Tax=Manis javanica TaxID=9974 RepID=UPI003C6D4607
MQGAEARQGQGQSSGGTGTRGRPWVIPLTYALVALEFTCLFMRFSILPYLSRRLGLDAVTFGYLQTTFGLLQLLGGPMFGRFADQHGARVAFTLSFLGSSAFYLLLAAACSPALPGMAFFWASRLPAVLMHTLPAAQMVIADLSAPKDRPAALARLGLCLGVGAILGSLLGGTLTEACGPQPHRWRICSGCWSHHPTQPPLRTHATERIRRFLSHPVLRAVAAVIQCPAIVALGGNLLGAGLSFTCIPASTKGACEHPQAALPGSPKASVFDLKAIAHVLLQPGVLPVFLIKVVSGLPSGLFMAMFPIISVDFLQLQAAQAGYLMSFFGVLQLVVQGLVIGRLSSHFSEGALLRASVLAFSMVGLAMALMSSVFHFCLLMPGLVFSLCALNVVTDSMLTKAVSASDTGTMLGLCASVQPLTQTLGPTLGGFLYHNFGVPIFGHVQLAVNFLTLLVLWKWPVPRKNKDH